MEILKRFGTEPESAERLAGQAAAAESVMGIHGVSVTARDTAARADRAAVEAHFRVHDTPTRRDPAHRTVELPKPVTAETAEKFNRVFGRA